MATYRSFEELEGKTLKLKDEVIFEVPTKFKLPYLVGYDRLNSKSASIIPAQIFIELGLDKIHEAALAYGYPSLMSSYPKQWPVTRLPDYPALTRLVLVLFKKCEELKIALGISKNTEKETVKESLYKVGDVVIVKDRYDPACGEDDYPHYFAEDMLGGYGNKKVTITKVEFISSSYYSKFKLYKEPYTYYIKEDSGEHSWSAAMFKGKAEEAMSWEHIFKKEEAIKKDTPSNSDSTIEELRRKYLEYLKKETVKKMEEETIQEKPFTIPLSYEEVKLSPKKPICKF